MALVRRRRRQAGKRRRIGVHAISSPTRWRGARCRGSSGWGLDNFPERRIAATGTAFPRERRVTHGPVRAAMDVGQPRVSAIRAPAKKQAANRDLWEPLVAAVRERGEITIRQGTLG
jgi:hypothetical protein